MIGVVYERYARERNVHFHWLTIDVSGHSPNENVHKFMTSWESVYEIYIYIHASQRDAYILIDQLFNDLCVISQLNKENVSFHQMKVPLKNMTS